MPDDYCCEVFRQALEAGDVEQVVSAFWIYGRPLGTNDGNGYFDDMTESLKIFYCPFCGAKLEVD